MQITRAGEYGILGLLNLARRAPEATVMIEDVSQEENIPKSFLAKIFQNLVRAGILRSVRGTGGGFVLAKAPEDITVLAIIEAIEGPIALQRCLTEHPDCDRAVNCTLCGIFGQAQDRMKEVLARSTLADLAATMSRAGVPAESSAPVPSVLMSAEPEPVSTTP